MRRLEHSFTLIETLLALSLASLALTAALTWMIGGLRTSLRLQEQTRWEQSARALLQLIHDDLTTGIGAPLARVEVGEGWVRVATLREDRPVDHLYQYDSSSEQIHFHRRIAAPVSSSEAEVVLGDVTGMYFSRSTERSTLRAELHGPLTLTREYPLLP